MVCRKVYAQSGAVAVFIAAILTVAAAVPVENKEVGLRAPGTVHLYFDQRDLVKRINVGLFTIVIQGFTKVTETACAVDVEPTSKAAICAVAVVGTVMALLYGAYKLIAAVNDGSRVIQNRNVDAYQALTAANVVLMERNAMDVRLASQAIHNIPIVEGKSRTQNWMELYNGTEPLLVGYHDCFGPGCFQVHYMNKVTARGRFLHNLKVSPRRDPSQSVEKRQDEEQSGNDNGLYGDYYYHNGAMAADSGIVAGDSTVAFEDEIEHLVDTDDWANTGVRCFDVIDQDINNSASSGYFVLNNDSDYTDTSQEDSWIDQCESMGPPTKF